MPQGSCLCGAVTVSVSQPLKPADACHCTQCRKQTGHYFASTNVARDALTIEGEEKVGWFQSSEKVRRGFCTICGSVLFWDPEERDWTAVAMGCFEKPTGTELEMHIHVASKGWSGRIAPRAILKHAGHVSPAHYYEIADGLPQSEQ